MTGIRAHAAAAGLLLALAGAAAAQEPSGSAGPTPAPVEAAPTGPPPGPPDARGWEPGPCPEVPRDVLVTDLRLDTRNARSTVLLVRTARTVRLTTTVRGERSSVRTVRRCVVTRVRLGRAHGTLKLRAVAGDVVDRRAFPF